MKAEDSVRFHTWFLATCGLTWCQDVPLPRYILLLSPQGQFPFLGGPPAWAIDETTLRNVIETCLRCETFQLVNFGGDIAKQYNVEWSRSCQCRMACGPKSGTASPLIGHAHAVCWSWPPWSG